MSSHLKEIEIIKRKELFDKFVDQTVKDKFLDFSMFPNIYKKNVTMITEGTDGIQINSNADIEFGIGCTGSTIVDTLNLQEIVPYSITTYNRSDTEVTSITKLVLPPEMEIIPDNAFTNLPNLEHIVFPINVRTIGDFVCKGLSKLKSVVFPGIQSIDSMGIGCFEDCVNLVEVVYPRNIVRTKHKNSFNFEYKTTAFQESEESSLKDAWSGIPDRTFKNCRSLKRFNLKNVTIVGYQAFMDCSSLETLYNCEHIEHILESGFANTSSLKILNNFNVIKTFGQRAFANSGLRGVYIHSDNDVILGSGAFGGNYNMDEFELYAPTIKIKDNCFAVCLNMVSCRLSNVVEIISQAFGQCGIAEIDLSSSSLELLPSVAFIRCDNLFRVVLPKTMRFIAADAFFQCASVCEFEMLATDCRCDVAYIFDPNYWRAPSIKFFIRQNTPFTQVAQRMVALRGGEITYYFD